MRDAPSRDESNQRRRSAGQSLVEFALVIPVFMLVFCGLFDGGRLIYMNSVASQAAREAARVVSVEAAWVGSSDPSCNTLGGPVCPANFTALLADATAAANREVAPFVTIPGGPTGNVYMSCDAVGSEPTGTWTTRSCASGSTGNIVSVRVAMSFTAVTPVIGQLIPQVNLSGDASMVIN